MNKETDDVVITGMGTVSSFGLNSDALWDAIQNGRYNPGDEDAESGHRTIRVRPEDLVPVLGTKGLRFVHRASRFLLAAAAAAVEEAGLPSGGVDPDRFGIVVGSNYANLHTADLYDRTLLTEGPRAVSAMEAPNLLVNAPAALLAIRLQARACNTTISTGACAGLDALGYAMTLLRRGKADCILVGGTEELSRQLLGIYTMAGALPAVPSEETGRPFDAFSRGITPGEGAVAVMLERRSFAEGRGARIQAQLASWTSGCAAGRTAAKREHSLTRVVGEALGKAEADLREVGLVVSGAGGLAALDGPEAEALHSLFGGMQTPVCAVKGVTGETGGAGGLFQLFAAVRSQVSGIVPATAGARVTVPALPPMGLSVQPARRESGGRRPAVLTAQDLSGTVSAVVIR
ncbi:MULTISPECIES: beta-ketoacyl synthase N-terminal-like domain-containing protein [Paenibacillus]|uniref:beta-ketoacyl synthase N-terminal-like domain-containing protein n=1 Tax=Paenibacillus TaxID=44249 RepID=UPI0022B88D05|nr:beta-ketoacyl synthase N-terminal-like domain-containing protein [Paenibacillus caseinilyticus]MCZ8519453.1 beta-ketoacyl synthase N-terminal-like domain-containing protein [Paenibacillus caseinilyticus]